MDKFDTTAAAIADRVGMPAHELASLLRERTSYVRSEWQSDALQATVAALLDEADRADGKPVDADKVARKAVDATRSEDKDLRLVKKPHRGKRIYLQRASLTTRGQADYAGGDRPIEGVAVRIDPPDTYSTSEFAKRVALMRIVYTKGQFECAKLLASEDASTRSVRNIQQQTGLSRREIQKVKDSLPRLRQYVDIIFP